MAAGDTNDFVEEIPPDSEYVAYMNGKWGLGTESAGKFSYEKWTSSAQKKLTEELA
jgi:hypothetical protein